MLEGQDSNLQGVLLLCKHRSVPAGETVRCGCQFRHLLLFHYLQRQYAWVYYLTLFGYFVSFALV